MNKERKVSLNKQTRGYKSKICSLFCYCLVYPYAFFLSVLCQLTASSDSTTHYTNLSFPYTHDMAIHSTRAIMRSGIPLQYPSTSCNQYSPEY